MIRIKLIFFIFIYGMSLAKGQEWEWVRQVSGGANDTGFEIDTDDEGNVFIAGRCKGTVTFENDGAPIVIPGYGYGDIFVSKYDKNGNLLWAQVAGSPEFGYDYAQDVVADGEGGCFITGFFLGDCNFGGDIYSSNGNRDAFVSHLSEDGDFLWTKTFGGSGIDQGCGLSLDNEGNLLFCGLVTGMIEIEGETMGFSGEYYGYIGKLNFDGDLIEMHFLQPPYKSNIYSISVDNEDNIYMCGAIFGSSTFNGTPLVTAHSPSRPDAFLLKCDAEFNPIWFQYDKEYFYGSN